MNGKSQRRRMFVNTKRQLPHLLGLSLLSIVNAMLLLLLLGWIFAFGTSDRISANLDSSFAYKVAILLFVTTMITAIWSLLTTRSASGVIKKIAKVLGQCANGCVADVENFKFRRTDSDVRDIEQNLRLVAERIRQRDALAAKVVLLLDEMEKDFAEREVSMDEMSARTRTIRKLIAQEEES